MVDYEDVKKKVEKLRAESRNEKQFIEAVSVWITSCSADREFLSSQKEPRSLRNW